MFHRNLELKLASLVLAVFLWFWVTLDEENPITRKSVDADIAAQGVGPGLVIELGAQKVRVTLRGLEQDVADLKGDVTASVSCRGLGVGKHYLPVKVRVPQDVALVSVRPATVAAALESIVSERVPVEVKVVGEPLAGFPVKRVEPSPSEVVVSGPRSRVERTDHVVVTADLSRMVPGVAAAVAARALDVSGAAIDGLSLSPARVKVTAMTERVVVAKTLPVVLRTRGSLPAGFRLASVEVEPPMVTLLLPADGAGAIAGIETEELDLSAVRGSITRAVGLVPPPGATLVDEGKVRVALRVERAPSQPQ
jgi:YbbR domain-containing protein